MAPIALDGPTAATITKQADAKFFARNKVVCEKIANLDKSRYDRLLSQTPRFPIGPIDTTIQVGDWGLYLKGALNDNGVALNSSYMERGFSFGNKTTIQTTTRWDGAEVAFIGSMDDTTSIKMDAKVVEEDGKLSVIFTANDWESYIRTITFRNGEKPEVILNNGQKDSTDYGVAAQLLDVQKGGDDISLKLRLVNNLANADLTYFNMKLGWNIDVSEATARNWMDLTVVKDTTVRVAQVNTGHGGPYNYSVQKLKNLLSVNIVDNYKGKKFRPVDLAGKYDGELSGAMYELGMRPERGNKSYPNSYSKLTLGPPMAPDTNAYLLQPDGIGSLQFAYGDSSKVAYRQGVYKDSVGVNVFGSLEGLSYVTRYFVIRPGNYTWKLGGGAILMDITSMGSADSTWKLRNGMMLDSGQVVKESGAYDVRREKKSTEFLIDFNMRVRVITPQHIVIEDISPEAMTGQKYATPVLNSVPYEKSSDTTDVPEPIAHSSVLKVYPNPVGDQLTIEAVGDGRQMFVNLLDIYGRVVKNVYNGVPENGTGSFPLNTSDLPSGVYFLQVRGTSRMEAIKVEIIH